jgi:hypothetical protein
MTSLPRGLRWLVGHGLENLDDQTEGFIDFEQRLDWTLRMVGHEGKRQTAEGPTQAWKKLPLDNSMTNDETQAAWH